MTADPVPENLLPITDVLSSGQYEHRVCVLRIRVTHITEETYEEWPGKDEML